MENHHPVVGPSNGAEKIKRYLSHLFYGRTPTTTIANDILVATNLFVILLALWGLFFELSPGFVYVEFCFGLFFLTEYLARFWVSRHKKAYFFRMVNVLDILVISSLLLTVIAPSLAFLRILRLMQILRAYRLLGRPFDHHNEFLHRNFEVLTAVVNIFVFLVIMSSVIYYQQGPINANINSYVDALYFTIAAVTTTGFGDIVVQGTWGKIISIFIMIFGVTLFFRLIKSIFVPRQLYVVCDSCGHDAHPLDAHFCKHCGHKLKNKHAEHYQAHKDDF